MNVFQNKKASGMKSIIMKNSNDLNQKLKEEELNETQMLMISLSSQMNQMMTEGMQTAQNKFAQSLKNQREWISMIVKESQNQTKNLQNFIEKTNAQIQQNSTNEIVSNFIKSLQQEIECYKKRQEQFQTLKKQMINQRMQFQDALQKQKNGSKQIISSKNLIIKKLKDKIAELITNQQQKQKQQEFKDHEIVELKQKVAILTQQVKESEEKNQYYKQVRKNIKTIKQSPQFKQIIKEIGELGKQINVNYQQNCEIDISSEIYQMFQISQFLSVQKKQINEKISSNMQRSIKNLNSNMKNLFDTKVKSYIQNSIKQLQNVKNNILLQQLQIEQQNNVSDELKNLTISMNTLMLMIDSQWKEYYRTCNNDKNMYQTKYNSLSTKIPRLEKEVNNNLQILKNQFKQKIQDINAKNQRLKVEIDSIVKDFTSKLIELQKYAKQKQDQNTTLQKTYEIQKGQLTLQKEKIISNKNQEIRSLQVNVRQLKLQIETNNNTNQTKLNKFTARLQLNIKQNQENVKKITDQYQKKIRQKQEQLKLKRQELKLKKQQLKVKIEQIQTIQYQAQRKQRQTSLFQDSKDKQNNRLRQEIQQLKHTITKNNQITEQYQKNKQKQLRKLENNLAILSTDQQRLSKEINQHKKYSYQLQQKLNQSIPFLSESDVFDYYKDKSDIIFFKNSIEKVTQKKIIGGRTIFRKCQQLNFHFFVDKIPNLMIVILLKNGVKVGGFAQVPIAADPPKGKGILFSTNKQCCYLLKQEQKAKPVTFDDYFFILGSSEIRIRSGETTLYSNFGIVQSFFDSKGHQIQDFLGGTDPTCRQMEMISYEIIEVRFKDEKTQKRPWYYPHLSN